ncbi:MAG TPA: outer membrane beta-barrel protein [Thermoanaerobaculia bacterium]|jgi:hypothetical protein|nr:outer membrane beta-barrel protein [Thermoanaerobaculia bacterium]
MRTLLILSLFCSLPLFAADAPNAHWRISVLATEISTSGNSSFAGNDAWSNDAHAGVGLGLAYVFSPQWDAEFTVASQTHRSPYTRLFYAEMPNQQPGIIVPATEFREYRVTPVDFSITRHFLVDQPIAPYVRAGVRYVGAPDDPTTLATFINGPSDVPQFVPVSEGFGLNDRVSAQVGAGVRVRLTERTALRAEATRLIRSEEQTFDPLMRYAVGFSWMF